MALGYYELTVSEHNDGTTLKTFLRKEYGISARSMTVLKYAGMGVTRRQEELRAHDILQTGDVVIIQLPAEKNEIIPVDGNLDILMENRYLLLINKPAGMPVHPTKIHQTDTLANLVAAYQRKRGEEYIFRALNRLDKDTSGCVLIAKDRIAYSMLQPTVRKAYVAVCQGEITEAGTVDAPIGLSDNSRIVRCIREDGDRAVTHYRPLRTANGHTLLELWLETGRTHQIRCHMSSIGHPLAGDDLYGGSRELISRQALHCREMRFTHPVSGEEICITTGIPSEFLQILH